MAKRPFKPTKPARKLAKPAGAKTVDVLNVNAPGKTYKRAAAKYEATRKALPEFGSTSGRWMKTVQLDAEARGEVVRDGGKPLRRRKVK